MIKTIKFRLSKLSLKLNSQLNAMLFVKDSKPILNHTLMLVRILVGKITPNWVRLTVILTHRMSLILRTQGLNGYVKHLKVLSVVIQQVAGGHYQKDLTSLGPRISRTSGGLPRILPFEVRSQIRAGNPLYIK
jgi:hypothetical protein